MTPKVSIVKYQKPFDSVVDAVNLSDAFKYLNKTDKVFIKPNVVIFSRNDSIPPFGVITTSRVVEDVVRCLIERGVKKIVIGEGTIAPDPKDTEISQYAFEKLGYNKLAKKYGAEVINIFKSTFQEIDFGDGIKLNFSENFLNSDFIVSLPVLKTHAQTKVSLGLKNLKGCIDTAGRKLCHSDNFSHDLDFHIAKIAKILPKSCTIIDGIYSLERGPLHTGTAQKTNLLIASNNIIAADIVGASVMGINPEEIPYLNHACAYNGMEADINSIEVVGESIKNVTKPHAWDFEYNKENTIPKFLELMGVKGLSFPKYDHSLCSYCSDIMGLIQFAILKHEGKKIFNNIEILTGKIQEPSQKMNHTILVGVCQVKLNKDNPKINNLILIPGCPPRPNLLIQGLKKAGLTINNEIISEYSIAFMGKYKNKSDYLERDYCIP